MAVAKDNNGRYWVYFGTGRFWSTIDREDPYSSYQQSFYGIKEPVDIHGNLTYGTVSKSNLLDVSDVEVYRGGHVEGISGISTFTGLVQEIENNWDGWRIDFPRTGERNLGQAAVLGGIVAFTTFVPSDDPCSYEGQSYLYALYYKTGTAYQASVIGVDLGTTDDNGNPLVLKSTELGKGLAITPNLHVGGRSSRHGEDKEARKFVQTSTGAIKDIEEQEALKIKSGIVSWEETY